MSEPEVSVVMPMFDAAATVHEAIRSVLDQKDVELELIVVDDHSSDDSRAVAESIADPRLRVILNRGEKGVVGAANTGIIEAKAEWVARMDADDRSLPRRFWHQLQFAKQHPEIGVVTGLVRPIQSQGEGMDRYVRWVNDLLGHDQIAANRFIESPVVNPSSMVRREWLERMSGYQDVSWAEDHDLWLRLLEGGCQIGRVDEVVLDWRDSPDRLTRSDPRYGDDARMEMRAHYISRMQGVRERGVIIGGAGPIGKLLARKLIDEKVEVHQFRDVNPKKHGQQIHGIPVVEADPLPQEKERPVLLGAVGVPGGREKVWAWAGRYGYREGVDFWMMC